MTPVDILSDAIIKLSLSPYHKHVYNIANPFGYAWKQYFSLINEFGFNVKIISSQEWVEQYIKHIDEDNALYSLKELYLQNKALSNQGPKFDFESSFTQEKLAQHNITYLKDYRNQIEIYMDYLKREEFFV